MNIVMWLAVGGLLGWVANLVLGAIERKEQLGNVAIGIAGAFFGGWLLAPLLGLSAAHQNGMTMPGFGVSLLGAFILLAFVSVMRRIG